MFKLFKDKLKSWLGKKEEEKPLKKAKKEKISKTSKKVKEKISKKSKVSKLPSDIELKKISNQIKEEVPEKFETGLLQYQPDIEKIKEEEKTREDKQEKAEEKKGFFARIFGKISSTKINQEQVDEIFQELEMILLENNVALEVVDKIKIKLNQDLVGKEVKKESINTAVNDSLKSAIEEVLQDSEDLIEEIKKHKGLYVIIFFGINGSGKTTSIAKLAHKLKKNNISVSLAAADTFRAAAVEQLEIHAKKIGVPIVKSQYGSDPTAVAFDAKAYSEKNNIKCLLIDTAGRMYTKENLIKQMEKIVRVIKPNKKIFVGESTTGNDMIDQVKTFNEAIGIDGIILSKADVDERGGTALSVSYVTSKPIYFLGTGQNYEDLEKFSKKEIIKNLGLD
ncbi:MAG: signal recognition particle-docking protein FtsY [Candidatus Pacearchaeota archaeon]